jgi:hypothetical protein
MRAAFAILTMAVLLVACSGNGCSSSSSARGAGGASSSATSSTATSSATSSTGGTGGTGGASSAAHVTVRVTDQNQQPIAGAAVVVNDAAGTVAVMTVSGTDGTVPATVPAGGSVSAYSSAGLAFQVLTVFAPPDGSTVGLVLAQPALASPTPPASTAYQEQVAGIPLEASALVFYTCAPTAYTETLAVPPPSSLVYTTSNLGCSTYPASSFLTVALDDAGAPLAWHATVDQPTSPGGELTVFDALDQGTFDVMTANIVGIPSDVAQTSIELHPLASLTGPLTFDVLQVAPGSPASYTAQFWTPASFFASYTIVERVFFGNATAESDITRERTYAQLPATSTFAADAMALVSVAPLDVQDGAHPVVTWSVGDGPRGDYGKLTLSWDSGTATNLYTAVFPSDQIAPFVLPDVPPELSSYAPSDASQFSLVTMGYVDEETATDYAHSSIFQTLPVVDGLGVVYSGGSNATATP